MQRDVRMQRAHEEQCGRARIEGPAILEQPDATTVIEPGLAGRIDALGNLIVEAQ